MSHLLASNVDVNTDWVDFALGEDNNQTEGRTEQDRLWSGAVKDGRAHISHREMTMAVSDRLRGSLFFFHLTEVLIDLLTDCAKKNALSHYFGGIPFLLREVVEFLQPNHAGLVMASINRRIISNEYFKTFQSQDKVSKDNFKLCIRKRPILAFEKLHTSVEEDERGQKEEKEASAANYIHVAYDACTGMSTKKKDTNEEMDDHLSNHVVFHDGKLARNGKRLSFTHHTFFGDQIYDDQCDNAVFTHHEVAPLYQNALQGHNSTIIFFGQTGTGKTYTLEASLSYLCNQFQSHCSPPISLPSTESLEQVGVSFIRVGFYEVHGKKCYDLLNNRSVVKLLADSNDDMHVRGAREYLFCTAKDMSAVEAAVGTSQDLYDIVNIRDELSTAMELRSAQVTERNPVSSRSHAVCSLQLTKISDYLVEKDFSQTASTSTSDRNECLSDMTGSTETKDAEKVVGIRKKGVIRLVDLAGSERNYETLEMKGARNVESADINKSLWALKDCFRAAAMKTQGNKLQILLPGMSKDAQRRAVKKKEDRAFSNYGKMGWEGDAGTTESTEKKKGKKLYSYCGLQPIGEEEREAVIAGSEEGKENDSSSAKGNNEGASKEKSAAKPWKKSTANSLTSTSAKAKKAQANASGTATVTTAKVATKDIRIPYRSHLLTRVLKDCFIYSNTNPMKTTVVATVSPSPIDLTHSINTLDHVVIMSSKLDKLKNNVEVDIPIYNYASSTMPMEEWNNSQVCAWLASADKGRYSMLVVPPQLRGRDLVELNTTGLAAMFAGTLRQGRGDEEGQAWVVDSSETSQAAASIANTTAGTTANATQEGIDLGFISDDGSSDSTVTIDVTLNAATTTAQEWAANSSIANHNANANVTINAVAATTMLPSGVPIRQSTISRALWSCIKREQASINRRIQLLASQFD